MLGLGVYDLLTRRRLHPAYVAAIAFSLALQLMAHALLHDPAWKVLTLRLIGH
jgi:pterin-4a-carbinolamine dehydratase